MVNQTPLLQGKDKQVIQLFQTEMTLEQIAQKLQVSTSSLNKIKELGLQRKRINRSKLHNKKALILAYQNKGLTFTQIAKKLGVHPSNLLKARKEMGIFEPNEELAQKIKKSREENLNGLKPTIEYRRRILDGCLDDIVQMLNNGFTKTDIAKKYNVCSGTVFSFLVRHDLKIKTKNKLSDKDETIKKIYLQGSSYQQIAIKAECSTSSVLSIIRKLKMNRPSDVVKVASRLALQEDRIIQMFNDGLSFREMAEKLKCHIPSVAQRIKKLGLKRDFSTVKRKPLLSAKNEQIKQMLKSGRSQYAIAKQLGVKNNTLWNHIKRSNLNGVDA